jgi:hypothetical protein
VEIQGYCDKKTQYRNTSVIHHASDLAFEPIDLDVEPRLHQFNVKNNGSSYQEVAVSRLSLHHTWMMVFYGIAV